MATKLSRIQTLGIKTETSQGTAATLSTSTDYVAVNSLDLKISRDVLERNYKRTTFGTSTSTTGKRWGEVTFQVDLIGSASAFNTGNQTFLAGFKACGFSASLGTANTCSFAPMSTSPTNMYSPAYSATVEVYKDGLKTVLVGCVGSVKIGAEVGKFPTAEFSLKGLISGSTTVLDGTTPTPTLITTTPPVVQSIGLVVGAYSPVGTTKLDIDAGMDIQEVDDVNSSNGVYGFVVTDRKPVGSIDPLIDTVANHAPINSMIAGTEFSTTCTIGSTVGNKIQITAANSQYADVTYGEKNGLVSYNGSLRFNDSSTGNDSLVIKLL